MKNPYVLIYVIKHDMDPNSNINYDRKIALMFACQSTVYFQSTKLNFISAQLMIQLQ